LETLTFGKYPFPLIGIMKEIKRKGLKGQKSGVLTLFKTYFLQLREQPQVRVFED
jgi:hypothetical protein